MTIQTRTIEYSHGDTLLEGFLAWDDAFDAPRPAVAVAHAWGGRGEFEQDKAVKLAELGYVGFALDMYGKGVQGSGPDENAELMAARGVYYTLNQLQFQDVTLKSDAS